MPKLSTIFRLAVMAGAAVVAIEGWQRYGPSMPQVKSLAARGLEIAHDALNKPQLAPAETSGLVKNQPGDAPALLTSPPAAPIDTPPIVVKDGVPTAPAVFAPDTTADSTSTASVERSAATNVGADRLPALMNRIHELGGIDPQLVSWGSSGQLYRFRCQATLSDAPNLKRHFESVAAKPEMAVEEVVAKVEAWRMAQQDRSRPR